MRRLWWATGVNSVGDGASAAAVALLAVGATGDPRLVSLVAAAGYLPWLLLSLPAGALVDRHERVGLMWRAQAVQAAVAGVLAGLALTGHASVAVLAVGAFALGACAVVAENAAQALLPALVPKPLLHRANGRQAVALTVGRQFLGPPLGGLLGAGALVVDAVSFAASAAIVSGLPRPERPQRTRVRLRHVHPLVRTLAVLLGVNTFCFQLGNVTLVLLATRELHLGPRGYGWLLAGAACGALLGGPAGAWLVARLGSLPALLGSLATASVGYVAVGFSPHATVLCGLLALTGFAATVWNVVTVSLRQELVPPELLGRVNAAYRTIGWGLIPLGALAGGFVAHEWGVRTAYPVAGALRALALLAAIPALRARVRADT
ncbi:MFS transporter [Virgisporangium aliadipatigenens]|uniref:MFS transporter n=1 Tax=Virgisporangium aliadipatigenens TaxID=741659 RepID=A0A8J3YED9_9ACTN|nr:MFS transporter [Virgisporangium aliadipatigenens]GIJ43471.1 MFS transporter [Virgisporangium aliadipatigenens]